MSSLVFPQQNVDILGSLMRIEQIQGARQQRELQERQFLQARREAVIQGQQQRQSAAALSQLMNPQTPHQNVMEQLQQLVGSGTVTMEAAQDFAQKRIDRTMDRQNIVSGREKLEQARIERKRVEDTRKLMESEKLLENLTPIEGASVNPARYNSVRDIAMRRGLAEPGDIPKAEEFGSSKELDQFVRDMQEANALNLSITRDPERFKGHGKAGKAIQDVVTADRTGESEENKRLLRQYASAVVQTAEKNAEQGTGSRVSVNVAPPITSGSRTFAEKGWLGDQLLLRKLDDLDQVPDDIIHEYTSLLGQAETKFDTFIAKTPIGRVQSKETKARMKAIQDTHVMTEDIFRTVRIITTGAAAPFRELEHLKGQIVSGQLTAAQFKTTIKRMKFLYSQAARLKEKFILEGVGAGSSDEVREFLIGRKIDKAYKDSDKFRDESMLSIDAELITDALSDGVKQRMQNGALSEQDALEGVARELMAKQLINEAEFIKLTGVQP